MIRGCGLGEGYVIGDEEGETSSNLCFQVLGMSDFGGDGG